VPNLKKKTSRCTMTPSDERMTKSVTPRSSLSIDNLRAIVILLVLSFHSVLAYLNFLPPAPFAFDSPPYLWRSFPIVDTERWLGFDLFCAWQDVFLMSFFVFLSGLFVWPSLDRKGALTFSSDRMLRLGLPFAVVVLVLMPLAHYPTYLQTATEPGLVAFWRHWLALPLWPIGPMWFLWLLLVGDIAAAALYPIIAPHAAALLRLSSYARRHPGRFLAGMLLASAIAYIPLELAFGASAWFQRGPFSFQLSRPLHYAVCFFAGAAIGACGIERGLLALDGPLPRRWKLWLAAALASFALWLVLTALVRSEIGAVPLGLRIVDDLSFVLACFASCFFALAFGLRFARLPSRILDSLKTNAYGMYLIHYVFVVWLQYALLGPKLPGIVKGTIVFGGTLALSWSATVALRQIPLVAEVIGAGSRRPAPTPVAGPVPARGPSEGMAD
jgi:peptidoglycan/LPS O-acetylase OafA/YrhL